MQVIIMQLITNKFKLILHSGMEQSRKQIRIVFKYVTAVSTTLDMPPIGGIYFPHTNCVCLVGQISCGKTHRIEWRTKRCQWHIYVHTYEKYMYLIFRHIMNTAYSMYIYIICFNCMKWLCISIYLCIYKYIQTYSCVLIDGKLEEF